MDSTADEWELCNDDGFIYKRKKRRIEDPHAVQGPDPEAEARQRRERKRKALLKIRRQYQKEIDQWEYMSNTLRAMQEKSQQQQQQQQPQGLDETASLLGSASKVVQENELGCGSLVDELLLQVEAQEAIIHDISSLCDVAEAMCSAQEEQLKQSFLDLPVWSSPHKLMASLCDE